MNKRWYDKSKKSEEVFEKLKKMDKEALAFVAENVVNVAGSIKAIKREQDEVPISIGIQRVIGLYQQNKNRRWYDKDATLNSAFQTMSTLSEDEYLGIIEALGMSLVD